MNITIKHDENWFRVRDYKNNEWVYFSLSDIKYAQFLDKPGYAYIWGKYEIINLDKSIIEIVDEKTMKQVLNPKVKMYY